MNDTVLVHDAGRSAGLGHRRRMEALADALTMRGFATQVRPTGEPVRASVVVVDSYRTRADDTRIYRGDRVVAVDDLRRDLSVDLLVDPAPGARAEWHRGARYVVAGAAYALVDPWLCDVPAATPADEVRRVLVTFGAGGGDAAGRVAGEIADALAGVDVTAVGARGGEVPRGVRALHGARGLADALGAADLVVTAGGVTLLEACALGRPIVAVCTADNQRVAVDGVVAHGAAVEASVDDVAAVARALAMDPARRRALASTARALVDGLGASRVADEIARLSALVL